MIPLADERLRQLAYDEYVCISESGRAMAVELLAARARIAELEAAQRPPLGYVVGFVTSAHGLTFARDYGGPGPTRAGAEQELAHEAEENPGVEFKLLELREAQP